MTSNLVVEVGVMGRVDFEKLEWLREEVAMVGLDKMRKCAVFGVFGGVEEPNCCVSMGNCWESSSNCL